MGCCSSSLSVAHSKSPTKVSLPNVTICQNSNIVIQPNTERVNPHQLQQHHDINQGQYESSEEDELPTSFANNRSIANEVMRLQQMDAGTHNNNKNTHNIETKSNEISEDVQFPNNESFVEFATHTINTNDAHHNTETNKNIELEDVYHPFGLIQTQNEEIVIDKQPENEERETELADEVVDNLELYAENLKQHGFDANKFRTANTSLSTQQYNKNQTTPSQSVDLSQISSFASSQMSQISISSKHDINKHYAFIVEHDEDEDEDEDDEDLILEELSRQTSIIDNGMGINDNYERSYIQSLKESVKSNHKINNIMDDQDEELMDAILSLDLDD